MKKLIYILVVFFTLPSFALAQSATSTATSTDEMAPYDAVMESGSKRVETVQSWRNQPPEIQAKINMLSPVAKYTIVVPVLFGLDAKNIKPTFGFPRDKGARTHEGEDLMGIKGTPVISPTSAVVLRVATGTNEGNYVSTANPGGETFVYMHLDKFAEGIKEGDVLEQGSLIGYLGDTGNAKGGPAHVHFEIHNSKGIATPPQSRLKIDLNLAQKNYLLGLIMKQNSDPEGLADFLTTNFKPIFFTSLIRGITLPNVIVNSLFHIKVANRFTKL